MNGKGWQAGEVEDVTGLREEVVDGTEDVGGAGIRAKEGTDGVMPGIEEESLSKQVIQDLVAVRLYW